MKDIETLKVIFFPNFSFYDPSYIFRILLWALLFFSKGTKFSVSGSKGKGPLGQSSLAGSVRDGNLWAGIFNTFH